MKRAEIVIGATYLARIGSELRPVTVLSAGHYDAKKFRIAADGKPLPKERSAAALRPVASRAGEDEELWSGGPSLPGDFGGPRK